MKNLALHFANSLIILSGERARAMKRHSFHPDIPSQRPTSMVLVHLAGSALTKMTKIVLDRTRRAAYLERSKINLILKIKDHLSQHEYTPPLIECVLWSESGNDEGANEEREHGKHLEKRTDESIRGDTFQGIMIAFGGKCLEQNKWFISCIYEE